MATISITKDELMAKLQEAKVKADREDAKAAAKHAKDEAAALEKFRDKLRAAIKWDWKTAKKHEFKVLDGYRYGPTCPTRHARNIEIAIQQLEMDSRKEPRMNLGDDHPWMEAALWLPPSERSKKSICDDE